MHSKIKFYQATGTDPYQNLAVEQWLTEQVQEGEILLYLWQNERTVVIGPAESVIGNAMAAHEFGGRYKRERYPARPLMGPTLTSTAPKLAQFWRDSVTD